MGAAEIERNPRLTPRHALKHALNHALSQMHACMHAHTDTRRRRRRLSDARNLAQYGHSPPASPVRCIVWPTAAMASGRSQGVRSAVNPSQLDAGSKQYGSANAPWQRTGARASGERPSLPSCQPMACLAMPTESAAKKSLCQKPSHVQIVITSTMSNDTHACYPPSSASYSQTSLD